MGISCLQMAFDCMRIDELADVYQHSKKMDGASSPTSCSASKFFFLKNLCIILRPLTMAVLRRSRSSAMSCGRPLMSKATFP